MAFQHYERALIIGAGSGLSASVARAFSQAGLQIALAARNPDKLADLAAETGGKAYAADVAAPASLDRLFADVTADGGAPDVLVYNPSARVRGPFIEIDRDDLRRAIEITAYGAFVTAQIAARSMLLRGHGAVLFTGASAGVKGFPRSASFAMGKFALRGLAESMARELHPLNIHVCHFVIDGAILNPGREEPADQPNAMLRPDAIAETYLHVLGQHPSAWTHEITVRPWVETF